MLIELRLYEKPFSIVQQTCSIHHVHLSFTFSVNYLFLSRLLLHSFLSSLAALVDPIRTSNGSTLLFATFTTNKYAHIVFLSFEDKHCPFCSLSLTSSASLTASAVCLFNLDEQFYDVFTAPSKQINRRTSIMNNEINELIRNCSQTISSTIDRDLVESDKQFTPYLSNPLLIETMATYTFTAINIISHDFDQYCLIIGTSK